MSKQEFLSKLRTSLNGSVEPDIVSENINYYEDYINKEVRKGKTESEVLRMLGDPRLIAKTIIETGAGKSRTEYQDADCRQADGFEEDFPYGYGNAGDHKVRAFRMPGWLLGCLLIVVLVVILWAVFSLLSFLAPLLIVGFIVIFLVKLFGQWLN